MLLLLRTLYIGAMDALVLQMRKPAPLREQKAEGGGEERIYSIIIFLEKF